jgi:tryptophan synthase beta chain
MLLRSPIFAAGSGGRTSPPYKSIPTPIFFYKKSQPFLVFIYQEHKDKENKMKKFDSRDISYLPDYFYNIKSDLKELPKPPLNPVTRNPLHPSELEAIFPKGLIEHETTMERFIEIPEKVKEIYRQYRPSPLIYARGLKQALNTPAHILYKYEGAGPTGSHKSNTAVVQAFLAREEGIKSLSTETGAGQWGSALSSACSYFDLKLKVFMVRISHRQKPGRRILMDLFGAEVLESPSDTTESGKKFLADNADHPGSLGIAIAEAVELAAKDTGTKYSLGSVLDSVLMHQTIIGQEAEKQIQEFESQPDIVIGCVGGGSNFAGLSFPFIKNVLVDGSDMRFIAVEPELCPTLTKGKLQYDFGDSSGLTPLLYMYSLGKEFVPPPIHAGGLRYHGMAPLISKLVSQGIIESVSIPQERVFEAGKLFFKTEGILPAPESSHAIATVIDEALKLKETGQDKVILFNLSGHGFLDISAYDQGLPH